MSTVITNISSRDIPLNPSILGDDGFEALGSILVAGAALTSNRPREIILTIPDIKAAYEAGELDIETIADADAILELTIEPAVDGFGKPVVTSVSCPTSGATGTADDVTILDPVPFDCQIFAADLITTTADAGGTGTLRSLPAAAGVALSSAITTAATGMASSVLTPPTIAKGSAIYLRRTDRSHVGVLKLWLLPV